MIEVVYRVTLKADDEQSLQFLSPSTVEEIINESDQALDTEGLIVIVEDITP